MVGEFSVGILDELTGRYISQKHPDVRGAQFHGIYRAHRALTDYYFPPRKRCNQNRTKPDRASGGDSDLEYRLEMLRGMAHVG